MALSNQCALLKNLELPNKSRLELPSIKQEFARFGRMPRLREGERHRDFLLGGLGGLEMGCPAGNVAGATDLLPIFLLVN